MILNVILMEKVDLECDFEDKLRKIRKSEKTSKKSEKREKCEKREKNEKCEKPYENLCIDIGPQVPKGP